MYFANVTRLSAKAAGYLGELNADIWMAAETHLCREDFSESIRHMIGGYKTDIAEPQPSLESTRGNTGGIVVAAKPHLATSSTLFANTVSAKSTTSTLIDMAGLTVHLQGSDVLLLGAYSRLGDYQATLRQVASVTKGGATAFILMCDFNATPHRGGSPSPDRRLAGCGAHPAGGSDQLPPRRWPHD